MKHLRRRDPCRHAAAPPRSTSPCPPTGLASPTRPAPDPQSGWRRGKEGRHSGGVPQSPHDPIPRVDAGIPADRGLRGTVIEHGPGAGVSPTPLSPTYLQTEPHPCSCRLARCWRGMIASISVATEACSVPSGASVQGVASAERHFGPTTEPMLQVEWPSTTLPTVNQTRVLFHPLRLGVRGHAHISHRPDTVLRERNTRFG